MTPTLDSIAFVGFGEAGAAFADGITVPAVAFDRKTGIEECRFAKQQDYARAAVRAAPTNSAAVAGATLILSLVTADNALAAALETAAGLTAGALYCDMNSVAPGTKRGAQAAITAAGGRYVDVAVMAPVLPLRRSAPLLVAGPHAAAAVAALTAAGFGDVREIAGPVGAAAAVKMIRSILIKGVEALTTDCLLAATRAGVIDEVFASLEAGWPADWRARADYNLDRMRVHGLRRAAEMDEVVKMLDSLGISAGMATATAQRQREIASLGHDADFLVGTPEASAYAEERQTA